MILSHALVRLQTNATVLWEKGTPPRGKSVQRQHVSPMEFVIALKTSATVNVIPTLAPRATSATVRRVAIQPYSINSEGEDS